ncbi:restriction endonuclease EcoRV [Motilibacter rhizosphaerae]|uniref:Restriction endonuclease EcoRV n=1 Tax=Motilibacter rhizosphaerae TaxID=598652 RepID=A0A4Q7NPJ6_9ACTN|nr:type II restriction endonuclease [Motilibacter rhizosphaerae]RZS86896.1 restriction endonuclease EcoRV [Motilibacter rhizosphaerae]
MSQVDATDLCGWLRATCGSYSYQLTGVLRSSNTVDLAWPLIAIDAADLASQLADRGQLMPLPKEPAALANVLEVSIVDFLLDRVVRVAGAGARRGTERGYPDLEIFGSAFGGGFHAVDVKIAQRKVLKRKASTQTQSRITLYTGNTYFRYPDVQWPGTFRAFREYASHLDVVGIYTLDDTSPGRVRDLEIIVQPPWRIASKQRSSTTREYIGAVMGLEDLRSGTGEFSSEAEFYRFWKAYKFKIGPAVQHQLDKIIAERSSSPDTPPPTEPLF